MCPVHVVAVRAVLTGDRAAETEYQLVRLQQVVRDYAASEQELGAGRKALDAVAALVRYRNKGLLWEHAFPQGASICIL